MSATAATFEAAAWPTARAVHVVTQAEISAHRRVVRSAIEGDPPFNSVPVVPSPVYPFILTWGVFDDAVRMVTAINGDSETPPTPVHLSEEIRIHRPLRVGEPIFVTADVVGVRPDPRGGRLALRSQLAIPDGAAVAELMTTVLLVGDISVAPFGHVPLQRGYGSAFWASAVTCDIPRDLPRRYADVSGHDNPIHLRRSAAEAAGFPDIVAQGMSIVAIACEQVIDRYAGGDASCVKAVGARFSGPVIPGEPLEICMSDLEGRLVHFCCITPRGAAVRKAWVELDSNSHGVSRRAAA